MTKKILITGAAGFIGSNVVDYLSKFDYDITATWNNHEPKVQLDNIRYYRVDLANIDETSELLKSFDYDTIVHLAGPMKGKLVKGYLRNSVNATDNLITLGEQLGVRTFIFASSIAVYGNTDTIVNENSDRVNLGDYATAKYIGERLLEDSNIEKRIAIRLPRMVGKNMDLSAPWLPGLAAKLMRNEEIVYFNPNLPYNNLAHTDTLGDFLVRIFRNENITPGGGCIPLGIGASSPMKVLDIIQYMKQELKSVSPLCEITDGVPRNTCFCIDISRAEKSGYRSWSVKETLARYMKDINELRMI